MLKVWYPDHELLIAKFRLKLKKVGKTISPFRYNLNQIPYDYTMDVTNRFKGLDLIECLKNPRDGGAWWAAIYGVARSRTRLKWLSSNSSSIMIFVLQHFIVFHEICLTPSKIEFLESHLQIESYEFKRGSGRRNCTYHTTDNLFSLY